VFLAVLEKEEKSLICRLKTFERMMLKFKAIASGLRFLDMSGKISKKPGGSVFVIYAVIVSFGVAFCQEATYEIQDSKMMCGPNCLWLAAKTLNRETTLQKMRYFAETDPHRGTSLRGMLTALRRIGLEPLLVKTDWNGLCKIRNPAILLLRRATSGHYVFLQDIDNETIVVIDAPDRKRYTRDEFVIQFTGYAIVVCRDPLDAKKLKASIEPKLNIGFLRILSASLGAVGLTILLISKCAVGRRLINRGRATAKS
jgi:hypothetical protein